MKLPVNKKDIKEFEKTSIENEESGRTLQMTLGKVTEVDEEKRVVRVKILESGKMLGYSEGSWFHIINSWADIKNRFGDIKKGFWVRIWWKGGSVPTNPWVEVIADETVKFRTYTPIEDGKVGVYKIFSPGIL